MLKIVNAPNPVLSQSAKPVAVWHLAKRISKVDKSVLKLIKDMEQTLLSAKDPVGVGLAAPQVGKSLQIFIAKPTPKSPILVFINPKIVSSIKKVPIFNTKYKIHNTKLEGCLSLPNIWGEVKRNPEIKLQYQLIANNSELITKTHTFSGFMSTIIQHETDHLNGILFPKRVLEQKGTLYKSHKNKKGKDEFEEIEI